MEFDIKNLNKELNALIKENKKLSNLKERYVEHGKRVLSLASRVEEINKELIYLAREIDPVLSTTTPRNGYTDLKPFVQECFDKIRQGTRLKTATIENLYPDLTRNQVYGISRKLEAMKLVGVTKKGKIKELYHKTDS